MIRSHEFGLHTAQEQESTGVQMRRLISAAILAVAGISTAGATMQPIPHGWKWYSNGRGSYGVCHPPELRRGEESGDRTGLGFEAKDGTSMVVATELYYRQAADLSMSISARRRDEEKEIARNGGHILRRAHGRKWIVSEGEFPNGDGERTGAYYFYRKILLAGDKYADLSLTIPIKEAPRWRARALRILDCFVG